MTVTTISLSDLSVGDCRARLITLLSPRTTVAVACNDLARLPVTVIAVALETTATTGGFLRFEGLTAATRLALQVVDPDRRLAVSDAARTSHVGDRPFQVRLAVDGSVHILLLKGIGQHLGGHYRPDIRGVGVVG